MARKCSINVNKGVLSGHNVSHSNRKTKRRFLPNMQNFSLLSEILGSFVKLRATPSSIRTVDHNNGLDNYLLTTSNLLLSTEAKLIKKRILKALKRKSTEKIG